jgi:Mrp family chromosome partitioning ATPase
MLGLFQKIDPLFPPTKSKIIQFIGSMEGEGTSTIAREFARVAAELIGLSVLLLDGDRHKPAQNQYFRLRSDNSWVDALRQGEECGTSFHQIRDSKLFVGPLSSCANCTPEIFNVPVFEQFCRDLRKEFDLVLIDSAPLSISPDGLAIASRVDGVILVVQAEKTKWQITKQVKESIARVGGNTVGAVMNKRRFHIPNSVYKHL